MLLQEFCKEVMFFLSIQSIDTCRSNDKTSRYLF